MAKGKSLYNSFCIISSNNAAWFFNTSGIISVLLSGFLFNKIHIVNGANFTTDMKEFKSGFGKGSSSLYKISYKSNVMT